MEFTPKEKIVTGYKATDENMCCRGFQFEIGEWYSHDGDLELCHSGFHFCEYPSGPWSYYERGRIFKVEAKEVLLSTGPGSDLKHVAKHIRFVEEIKITGCGNTGYRNTGDKNTGDRNTGNRNTGYGNTGDKNTGDWNTGNENTGDWNTGNENTGDWNTGYRNTGDKNTGDWNTGNRNTGDWNTGNGNTGYGNTGNENTGDWNTGNENTGDWNTGHGNQGDYHSGCLNYGEAKFFIFNKIAKRDSVDFNLVHNLSMLLLKDDEIDPSLFLSLPNATEAAIKELHEAHINARKQQNLA